MLSLNNINEPRSPLITLATIVARLLKGVKDFQNLHHTIDENLDLTPGRVEYFLISAGLKNYDKIAIFTQILRIDALYRLILPPYFGEVSSVFKKNSEACLRELVGFMKIPFCSGMKNHLSSLVQSLGGTTINILSPRMETRLSTNQ